jgi:hypothetical protein
MTSKGPRLTIEQAEALLARRRRMYDAGYAPPRAFRVFHAYQLLAGEGVRTRGGRRFMITGPPERETRKLLGWGRRHLLVAVAPSGGGWRMILSPMPIDPACWI